MEKSCTENLQEEIISLNISHILGKIPCLVDEVKK
jgi:hypothetical protein